MRKIATKNALPRNSCALRCSSSAPPRRSVHPLGRVGCGDVGRRRFADRVLVEALRDVALDGDDEILIDVADRAAAARELVARDRAIAEPANVSGLVSSRPGMRSASTACRSSLNCAARARRRCRTRHRRRGACSPWSRRRRCGWRRRRPECSRRRAWRRRDRCAGASRADRRGSCRSRSVTPGDARSARAAPARRARPPGGSRRPRPPPRSARPPAGPSRCFSMSISAPGMSAHALADAL